MSNTDGGFAFPVPAPHVAAGMSLRDYFAAQALSGILAALLEGGVIDPHRYHERIAAEAYQHADAMLKERAK